MAKPASCQDVHDRAKEEAAIRNAFISGPIKYPQFPADRELRMPATPRVFDPRIPDTETIIVTASYGAVVFEGELSREGKFVIVYHGDNIYTTYSNLKKSFVGLGQILNSGDLLGAVDNEDAVVFERERFAIIVDGLRRYSQKFIEEFNRSMRTEE